MAGVVGPLQFDDDKVGVSIEAKQVDAPAAVRPVGELFGHHHDVGSQQDRDVGLDAALNVFSLAQARAVAKVVSATGTKDLSSMR